MTAKTWLQRVPGVGTWDWRRARAPPRRARNGGSRLRGRGLSGAGGLILGGSTGAELVGSDPKRLLALHAVGAVAVSSNRGLLCSHGVWPLILRIRSIDDELRRGLAGCVCPMRACARGGFVSVDVAISGLSRSPC